MNFGKRLPHQNQATFRVAGYIRVERLDIDLVTLTIYYYSYTGYPDYILFNQGNYIAISKKTLALGFKKIY